jgi:hypothetical protein
VTLPSPWFLLAIPAVLLVWYVMWVLYLATQCLAVNKDKLEPWVFQMGMFTFRLALVIDVAFNWIVFTVLFYEFPRELTGSGRLSRHLRHGYGWRQRFSGWVGRTMLDPFDPSGQHI